MKKWLVVPALVAPMLLGGCVISVDGEGSGSYHSDWQDREYKNRKKIAQLTPDMSYQQVVDRMGVADFNELHQRDDGETRVLFYRTQRRADDGVTTKDECTPLVFKNGNLVGWGESAYQHM